MADERLRELERRWRATGAVDDERLFLAERVRLGALHSERLALAGSLGHPAALGNGPAAKSDDLLEWVNGLAGRTHRSLLAVAMGVVKRTPGSSAAPVQDAMELARRIAEGEDLPADLLVFAKRDLSRYSAPLRGSEGTKAWSAHRLLEVALLGPEPGRAGLILVKSVVSGALESGVAVDDVRMGIMESLLE